MSFSRKPLILLVFIGTIVSAHALAIQSQEEAFHEAAVMQKEASDASLQNSTVSAMRGLMDLAAQNRSGAIQNGYKAYGQYRTSEDLDVLRMKSRLNFYKAAANVENVVISSAGKYKIEPLTDYKTTFARLDPNFMREGEAGKVADEFEKKTGMKRDKLLKIMAKASESTISPSDPKLVDKVISRFEGFLKEIPNEEFRKNVQKTIDEVPATMRTGMIAKGVQKIAEIMAKMPADKSSIVAKAAPAEAERKPAAVATAEAPAATAPTPEPSEDAAEAAARHAAATANVRMMPTESGYKGLEKENFAKSDMLGSVMQTALEEQKEDTIFKQVSKRYRAMTPQLSLVTEKNP